MAEWKQLMIEDVALDHTPDERVVHTQEPMVKLMLRQEFIEAGFTREHVAEDRVFVVERRGIGVAHAHLMFVQKDSGLSGLSLCDRVVDRTRPRVVTR
jgi:hypothetical protein